jgi:hypothetical protein
VIGSLGISALGTIVGTMVASRLGIPANYTLAAGLGIGGAGAYAFKQRKSAAALLGAGVGLAALPYVSSILTPKSASTASTGTVWA